jgi:hypothetical protein
MSDPRPGFQPAPPKAAPTNAPSPPPKPCPMHNGVKHGTWLNPATMEYECWWMGELRWTITAHAMHELKQCAAPPERPR